MDFKAVLVTDELGDDRMEIADALKARIIPAATAGEAAESGSAVIFCEDIIAQGLATPVKGAKNIALLDGQADWFDRYEGCCLADLSAFLDKMDAVLAHDQRALAQVSLLTKSKIAWLGIPHCGKWRTQIDGGNPPRILLLPGNESTFLGRYELERRLVASIPGVAFAGQGEPARCALVLDPRPYFGQEIMRLAADGIPCVGSVSLAAQRMLFPALAVDAVSGLAQARALLLELCHGRALHAVELEKARARLADTLSPSAVLRRFMDCL